MTSSGPALGYPNGEPRRTLRHDYIPLGEGNTLSPTDRKELGALCAHSGPPALLPELVECLAEGGVSPIPRKGGGQLQQRYGVVVVRDAAGIVAAATVLSTSEVLFDLLAKGGWLKAAGHLVRAHPRRLGARTLCVGTPLCQEAGTLVRPGSSPAQWSSALDSGLHAAAESLGCHAVLWKDIEPRGALHSALLDRGYHDFPTLPAATIQLSPHATLHDFLEWIRSVTSYGDLRRKMRDGAYDSPGMREHLSRCIARTQEDLPAERGRGGDFGARSAHAIETYLQGARQRALRAVQKAGETFAIATGAGCDIRFEVLREPPPRLLDQIHDLYAAQLARSAYRWEVLTPRFFRALSALPEASFAVVHAAGELLGFSASVIVGHQFEALRSGVRPGIGRALSLPALLILRDIETALQAGCRTILLGPTGYALKARFGAAFAPRVSMLRMLPPWSLLTRPVAAAIRQANRRAGVADLHRMDFHKAWTPRTIPDEPQAR